MTSKWFVDKFWTYQLAVNTSSNFLVKQTFAGSSRSSSCTRGSPHNTLFPKCGMVQSENKPRQTQVSRQVQAEVPVSVKIKRGCL